MNYRRINCQCGVKHWSTCPSEVKIKCRCGRALILEACGAASSSVYTFNNSG